MARGMKAKNVQRLIDERDKLVDDMEALKHRIGGLELAISLLEKDDDGQAENGTSGRGKAKELLLDLLKEAGTTGLNATTAVEIAARRGKKLQRGTAASTLSRLKTDGVVLHEHDRYRLVEFARPKIAAVSGSWANVTSGAAAGNIKAS